MSDQVKSTVPKHGPRVVTDEGPCVLGREIHFVGTLKTGQEITILGRVTGTICASRSLVVGKEAQIDATIEGQRVKVMGRVKGNIVGKERVELGPSASVVGEVIAPVVHVDEGARFEGRVRRPGNRPDGWLRGLLQR